MGNGFNKVYLDNKTTDTSKNGPTEKKTECRSPDNKILFFDQLHSHSFNILPQQLLGIGATVSHKVARHAYLSHTFNLDVFSKSKEKQYLLDIQWYGCGECHYAKSELSKHINRLMASLSLNPFQYFPNSQTLSLKNMALTYTTDNFSTGISTQNLVVGDKAVLTSLSDPHEIAKNCNHFSAEITYAMTPSIIIGLRVKRSGFDNGFARVDQSNSISFATRVALPSNAAVFSTQIGEGALDLHMSTNLMPQLQFALAIHSSLAHVSTNVVNYGFKLTLPDESTEISVAVDTHWKVEASVKKQISAVQLVATSAFSSTGNKFGFGIETSF